MWLIKNLPVNIETEVRHTGNVDFPHLFLNTDAPHVEVEHEAEEEIHRENSILHCPVQHLSPLTGVVLHQGEEVREQG